MSLHLICGLCNQYGHLARDCVLKKVMSENHVSILTVEKEGSEVGMGVQNSRNFDHNDTVNLNSNPPFASKEIVKDKEWILTENKKKKSKALMKERER